MKREEGKVKHETIEKKCIILSIQGEKNLQPHSFALVILVVPLLKKKSLSC